MRVIILTQGQHTVVEDHVFVWASKFKWRAHKGKRGNFYAVREVRLENGQRASVYLHREIMKAAPGVFVDHIDGDGLNNLDNNLRLCTTQENNHNTPRRLDNASGFKGVSFFRRDGTWRAQIQSGGRNMHLGYFETPREAARAYDTAALECFGDFSRLNFPKGAYEKV